MRPSSFVTGLGMAAAALFAAHGAALAQSRQASLSAVAGYVGSATVVQGVTEQGTGLWYGLRADAQFGPVDVELRGLKGTLAPEAGSAGYTRDGGEIRGAARLNIVSWAALEAGFTVRAFSSPAGYQKWVIPDLGARVTIPLGAEGFMGYVRGAYLPSASAQGLPSSTLGLAVEAGLKIEPRSSWFMFGAFYRLERLDFGNSPGSRLEQFDVLGVSIGARLGRSSPAVAP